MAWIPYGNIAVFPPRKPRLPRIRRWIHRRPQDHPTGIGRPPRETQAAFGVLGFRFPAPIADKGIADNSGVPAVSKSSTGEVYLEGAPRKTFRVGPMGRTAVSEAAHGSSILSPGTDWLARARSLKTGKNAEVDESSPPHSEVAQRSCVRLLTGKTLVRIQPSEPCPRTHRVKRPDCRSGEESSSLFGGAAPASRSWERSRFVSEIRVVRPHPPAPRRPHRLTGRSPAFQAANTGSTPVGVAGRELVW